MPYAGELAALGAALCWATSSNLFAAAGQYFGSVALNRLRIAVALVFLMTALTITHGAPFPTWASGTQLALLAASGLVGYVFGDAHYFRSLVILGPGRATTLGSLAPLFVLILAWPVLGEVPGPLAVVGVALIVGGVTWVALERAHVTHEHIEGSVAAGIWGGVLGALGQGGGFILAKMAIRLGLDPISATVVRASAATVALWAWAAYRGEIRSTLTAARGNGRASALMTVGAFGGPFLGVTLSMLALEYTSAGVAASIAAFYPVIAILIAMRFHHEKVTARLVLGALIAVVGVVVLFLH